jgi:hypothetical protein
MSYDSDLLKVWNKLGDVEKRVLLRIAGRLAMGQEAFGPFGEKDRSRDFMREIQEEAMDQAVYAAAFMELNRK